MESELLFAETMKAGDRRYDFEVRRTLSGDRCLLVRERREQQGKMVANATIMVHGDHLQGFRRAMRVALQFMKSDSRGSTRRPRGPSVGGLAATRQSFPNAYAKWTGEDDDRLKALFAGGLGIDDLAAKFQRQPSAIRSRLLKLGLIEES